MYKKQLLVLLFSLFTLSLFAQNTGVVKGVLIDTASRTKLNATVQVLNAKDSILRKFTYADENGAFTIGGLLEGKFILLVTYPEYADFVGKFTIDAAHTTHQFGSVNMQLKAKLLKDVLIKGEVTAIKIKGDTTEFNAKAYVIQPNDKVEDLLRQLPGIQVDQDGKITAQGKPVPKVLLDGEEFFGDDPTLVTKNIRADMVAKVQLYDKKSDQAEFTGIDDGKRTKTINIVLKEDKKKGTFGKVQGGLGTDGYYESQVLYNRFVNKEKISAYFTAANDGKLGLGFTEDNKLGTSTGVAVVSPDGNGITTQYFNLDELDNFSGSYRGNGSPTTQSSGAHYDGKSNDDKVTINTNYRIASLDVTGTNSVLSQITLPTGIQNSNSNKSFNNHAFRQKVDFSYLVKLDTSSTFKVAVDGALKNSSKTSNTLTTTTDGNGNLLNRNTLGLTNKGDQQIFDASLLYTKKFHKKGRTFSWSVSEAYTKGTFTGYQTSELDFYNPTTGKQDSAQLINQYKPINTNSSVLNSNMTYSEPLSKAWALLFDYGFNVNNSTADKESFNQSASGRYDVFDPVYSNNFKFNQLSNQVGAIFNYKKGRAFFNFGTKVSAVDFKQTDQFTGNNYNRNFINWLPQAEYEYKLPKSYLDVEYNGNTTQPTIDQLQPVLVNTDPLNITIGNADLTPSFKHDLRVSFNVTQPSLYLSTDYSFTENQIVSNRMTDATGKSTTQYVNLKNYTPYSYSVYLNLNKGVKQPDISFRAGINVGGNVGYSYINGLLDRSQNYTYSLRLGVSSYKANKYNLSASFTPAYTFTQMSLTPQNNNNAPGAVTSARVTLYLPAKFQIASDYNYTYTAQTQDLTAENISLLNASIAKTFFKGDALKLSLAGNDLFNQNQQFNRSVTANAVTQSTSSVIKRYFMLSVSWDFTKFGTIPEKKS